MVQSPKAICIPAHPFFEPFSFSQVTLPLELGLAISLCQWEEGDGQGWGQRAAVGSPQIAGRQPQEQRQRIQTHSLPMSRQTSLGDTPPWYRLGIEGGSQ